MCDSILAFRAFSHLIGRNQSETEQMSTDWPYDPETGEIVDSSQRQYWRIFGHRDFATRCKRPLEETFGHVRVRGEISGYRGPIPPAIAISRIKDEGAKLDAVIWRGHSSKLRAKMQEGLEVIATGKITSYPGKSNYQIVIENIEPAGVGALMALLEERKRKLAAEGLFDADRKKPAPYLPKLIGVVTSPTGAVIRDILHRLSDRFPRHVMVWPVRVQGETCGGRSGRRHSRLQCHGRQCRPDLLIVARGGGSLEDLWGFNEEIVVRAVAESRIPLISAVGHETDSTLIDLVADHRAPTPTAAAERAVPVRADLHIKVTGSGPAWRAGGHVPRRSGSDRSVARGLPRPMIFWRSRASAMMARRRGSGVRSRPMPTPIAWLWRAPRPASGRIS